VPHLPARAWTVVYAAAFVPGYGGGPVTDSHRLPHEGILPLEGIFGIKVSRMTSGSQVLLSVSEVAAHFREGDATSLRIAFTGFVFILSAVPWWARWCRGMSVGGGHEFSASLKVPSTTRLKSPSTCGDHKNIDIQVRLCYKR
jgi:hypothetical protein